MIEALDNDGVLLLLCITNLITLIFGAYLGWNAQKKRISSVAEIMNSTRPPSRRR